MTILINLAILGMLALTETAQPLAHATPAHRLIPLAAAALLIGAVVLARRRSTAGASQRRPSRRSRRSF